VPPLRQLLISRSVLNARDLILQYSLSTQLVEYMIPWVLYRPRRVAKGPHVSLAQIVSAHVTDLNPPFIENLQERVKLLM
jgi:hypothetical protein